MSFDVVGGLKDIYGKEVNIDAEQKIWSEFMEDFKEYDERDILDCVKGIIDLLTEFVMQPNEKIKTVARLAEFRREYAQKYFKDLNQIQDGDEKSDVIQRKFRNIIINDECISNKLQKIFGIDGAKILHFVDWVVELNRSTKMKVFIFNYLE